MFSKISTHLFGAYAALLLLVILSTHHSCRARKTNNYCAPSSCGNFHNISYPFRLSTDPESCGNKNYELACENNERLTLHLNMVKYYVQAINYSDLSIRLVDAAVQKYDCFSLPHPLSFRRLDYSVKSSFTLVFISCENPILNPPAYIVDTSSCKNDSSTAYNSTSSSSVSSPSFFNMEGYSYVMVGGVKMADIPDLCRINLICYVPGFLLPENKTNMSYIDVHDILVYGFELSWFSPCCGSVRENRCGYLDKTAMASYCVGIVIDCYLKGIDWVINRIMAKWLKGTWLNARYLKGVMSIINRSIDHNSMSYRNPGTTIASNLLIILVNLFLTLLLVLLVLIGRRKNLNVLVNHSSRIYFPAWVYDKISEGKDIEIQEDATEYEKKIIKKVMIVALWCIQLKPDDRPSMHKVVEMLESDIDFLRIPPKPFLGPHQILEDDDRANPTRLSNPLNDCIDSSYKFGR